MIKKEIQVPYPFLPRQLNKLVRTAENSFTPIYLEKSGRMVCANKMIGVLSLQIRPGDKIFILDFTGANEKFVNDMLHIFEKVS